MCASRALTATEKKLCAKREVALLMAWSRESHSVCLGVETQIKNFIKRSHVQLLNRRSKQRDTHMYLSSEKIN